MNDLQSHPGDIMAWGFPLQPLSNTGFLNSSVAWSLFNMLGSSDEVAGYSAFQSKIISGINSQYDVFAVGPKHQEQRSAALFLLLTHAVKSRAETPLMNRAFSPSVLIVCPSVTAALSMENTINNVLKPSIANAEEMPTVLMLDSLTDAKALVSLSTQVDILLLTGELFTSLLHNEPSDWMMLRLRLEFQRLKYVLFEEVGMYEPRMAPEIMKFLGYLGVITSKKIVMTDPQPPEDLQVLFIGTGWNDKTTEICNELKNNGRETIKIFASTFHSLQCIKPKWMTKHCSHESVKFSELKEICELMLMYRRSVLIACNTAELACKVSKALSNVSAIGHTLYTLEGVEQVGLLKSSFRAMNRIYVVSDDALHLVDVLNISCLIHFDIEVPSHQVSSWPFNPDRFVSMLKKIVRCNETSALVYLLVTGSEPNLLNLTNYLKLFSIDCPSSLKSTVEKLNDIRAPSLSICSALKWFGQCDKLNGICLHRHKFLLQEIQVPDAPTQGELEFKVVSCDSPSMYIGLKIRHFIFQNGKRECVKSFSEELQEQISQLTEYYSIEGNKVCPTKVSVGDLFCIPNCLGNHSKENKETYLRVKIINEIHVCKLHLSELSSHETFRGFCIDFGIKLRIPAKNLLVMPQNSKKWQPHAVEVVLSNTFPPIQMEEYTSSGIAVARELTQGRNWNANILVAIGNIVWVNQMVTLEQDPISGHFNQICNARATLVSRKHASFTSDVQSMFDLLQLIRETQPNYPEFPHERNSFVPTEKQIKRMCTEFHHPGSLVSWASLPMSSMGPGLNLFPVIINLGTVNSPWEIYGTPQVKDGRVFQIAPVTKLEEDLSKDVEELLLRQFYGKRKDFSNYFVTGGVVAVYPPEKMKRWARGLITETKPDDDGTKFTVFLVDHGVHINGIREKNLMPLFQKYVEMLPFQAFSFTLLHIQPLNFGPWDNDSSTIFSRVMDTLVLSRDKNEVTLVALKSENRTLGCYHYRALAFVSYLTSDCKEKEVEVGSHYVSMGYARLVVSEDEPTKELVTFGTVRLF
ncbi:unnamed protein product [Orchesella dallaii]|uniref:RNA helicase n=1 Tax=Orchesella dallaii TaxID=48710 RepID=A0ABP1S327_9HEXA